MADEPKVPPEGGTGETPAKPAPAAGTPAPSTPKAAPEATAKPAVPAKPAAPPTPKPPVAPEPWSSPLLEAIQKKFPGAVQEAVTFRGQPSVIVACENFLAVAEFLKTSEGGEYSLLTDHTAVDYPKREKRFDLIYQLYSFKGNDRLRLKVVLGETEKAPSVTGLWPAANWLEREVYDMFGVQYEGHPDLKRILLPDAWTGHPLRKDYDILRQDVQWVQTNLGIESGQ